MASNGPTTSAPASVRRNRADAKRNRESLLAAAAAVFVSSGVNAPIREIATEAGVGTATIYRHFPTRTDLVVAVYRHQVEACAEAGPDLLAHNESPFAALHQWVDLFIGFLVTKHGLADALQSDRAEFSGLHAYFLNRLMPVCAQLLDAAESAGEIRSSIGAYELMRGIGNLCIGDGSDTKYDPRRLVELIMLGMKKPDKATRNRHR